MSENRTAFRELRLAAGYGTAAALAEKLGLRRETVKNWDNSAKPRWHHMPILAEALQVQIEDGIRTLWKESIGDPCPCGCGGIRVFPKTPGAECLGIELPCSDCGPNAIRFYPQRGRGHHRKLCPKCAAFRRRDQPVPFTCVGYDDHDTKDLHARRCFGTKNMVPHQIRKYPNQSDNGASYQRAFIDEATKKFRCAPCASAARAIAQLERKLKVVTTERLRSREQRKEIAAEFFDEVFKRPKKFTDGQNWHGEAQAFKALRTRTTTAGRLARVRGRLYAEWSGKNLPKLSIRPLRGMYEARDGASRKASSVSWAMLF